MNMMTTMTFPNDALRRLRTISAAVLLSLAASGFAAPAKQDNVLLKPTPAQAQAAIDATNILTHFHYKAEPLDAKMSAAIFDRYFDSLDADRLFFLQSDVDKFKIDRDKLGDDIMSENLTLPYAVFNLYEQRVAERTAYARDLLKKGSFDFSKDESYNFQRDKGPWAKTDAEVNDLWRQRTKNDWLRLKLAGKKDADIKPILDKRYANYLDRIHQLSGEDVFQTFMNAYAMSIDPHTNYLGPRASENFDISMRLSLEGIGAVLQRDDDYTAIREIVPGGPAALSGKFKVGDRIIGVGQGESGQLTDVVGWRLDDVVDKIRGQKDTAVRLEVLPADAGPDGKHQTIALVRKKVSIEEQAAKSSVIEVKNDTTAHKIGVISLPTFYEDFDARRRGDKDYKSATRDVAKLLAELKKQNVDGVLVDLRNNGGGSLTEAIDLTGLFTGKGAVVQVRNASGRIEEGRNMHTDMVWDGPLAVLVNRNSASASEIFAAAIQDYGRGLIVGEPTYGKGTVQNLVDLDQLKQNEKPTLGELKMTIQQFFRIDGGSTQLRGVSPDIAFPITADFDQNGEQNYDNALAWSSISAATYAPTSDLKSVVPTLETLHASRAASDKAWQAYQADVTDFRKLRKDTTISLNEQTRREERDAQEKTRKERHPELYASTTKASAEPSSGTARGSVDAPNSATRRVDAETSNPVAVVDSKADKKQPAGTENDSQIKPVPAVAKAPDKDQKASEDVRSDDGLQADERSLQAELAQEKKRKNEKDVVLTEAAHILSDEVDLIHNDTKLAARVLPRQALHAAVD
ncbi:MAG: carboxy terminal-processing peptidase [Rudaea sp.]